MHAQPRIRLRPKISATCTKKPAQCNPIRSVYEQLEDRKTLLRDLAVEFALLIMGFRWNTAVLQCRVDRITDSAPLGQDENLAGMPSVLVDLVVHKGRDRLCLTGHIGYCTIQISPGPLAGTGVN